MENYTEQILTATGLCNDYLSLFNTHHIEGEA